MFLFLPRNMFDIPLFISFCFYSTQPAAQRSLQHAVIMEATWYDTQPPPRTLAGRHIAVLSRCVAMPLFLWCTMFLKPLPASYTRKRRYRPTTLPLSHGLGIAIILRDACNRRILVRAIFVPTITLLYFLPIFLLHVRQPPGDPVARWLLISSPSPSWLLSPSLEGLPYALQKVRF